MRTIGIVFILIVLAVATLSLLPSPQNNKPERDQPILPLEPAQNSIRNVTPGDALPGPDIAGKQVARLPGVVVEIAQKATPTTRLYNNISINAAGILASGNTNLHIEGITPLPLDAVCKTTTGETWPCGRFARTAMRKLIRGRSINCDATNSEDVLPTPGPILTKCRVANQDIGQWLVKQGWAEDDGGDYAEPMQWAKTAKLGMWRQTLP